MSRTRSRGLNEPHESLTFDHGRIDWVVIGEQTIGRSIQEPGWRWSTHIWPIVGGEWCLSRHVGVLVPGRMHIVMDDGDEFDFGPHDVIEVAPGHDAWVVGEEPVVSIEWSGVRGWIEPLESLNERVLATVAVTDIVDPTGHATRLGGSRWNDLLARRNSRMRDVVGRSGAERSRRRARVPRGPRRCGLGRSGAPGRWWIRHPRTGSRFAPRPTRAR